jgi:hypothetical protein
MWGMLKLNIKKNKFNKDNLKKTFGEILYQKKNLVGEIL